MTNFKLNVFNLLPYMKLALTAFFVLTFNCYCFSQSSKLFRIEETIVTDTLHKKKSSDFTRENQNLFEDDNYVVRKTCSGEWGGTIWFKNKRTGIVRSCSATCPVIVNKLNGKYIITATLNHLSGFSQIIEIDNPELLTIFKLPKPRKKNGKTLLRYVGDDESRSTQGSKVILDTTRVSTLVSFPLDGRLFHVITDYRKTYLAEIKNKRFVTIDTLSQKSFWSYDSDVFKTNDGHIIVFFKNEEAEGYLDIFNHEIHIIQYR